MIVVKSIEVEEVQEDIINIMRREPTNEMVLDQYYDHMEQIKVMIERVKGKQFIMPNGEKICIGLSKQVQDTIGTVFEAIETQHKEYMELHTKLVKTQRELDQATAWGLGWENHTDHLLEMSWKDRMKHLFKPFTKEDLCSKENV